jgi:hypothetical protein
VFVLATCPADTSLFTGPAFCSSCICAVGTALVSGFDRAGVLINGQRVGDLAAADSEAGVGAVNALMANCSAILGVQVRQCPGCCLHCYDKAHHTCRSDTRLRNQRKRLLLALLHIVCDTC